MFPLNMANLPWKVIGGALGALLLVFAVWAFGHSRYRAGVDDTDAKWKAAEAKLQAEAVQAAGSASEKAIVREADHAAKLEAEKEKIDEALRTGSSPLDALFGVQD